MEHEVAKALEVWSLQTALDVSILLGFLALGLALVGAYQQRVGRLLTLRVSTEIWNVLFVVLVDVLLAMVVLVGLLVVNPDVMADIKMAVPFYPAAVVLMAIVLVVRLFHRGHEPGTEAHYTSLWLLFVANAINLLGYTFVMEAASGEYLATHPNSAWTWIKEHLRSNAAPAGLELAHQTFWICFPLLILVFAWAFGKAIRRLDASGRKAA